MKIATISFATGIKYCGQVFLAHKDLPQKKEGKNMHCWSRLRSVVVLGFLGMILNFQGVVHAEESLQYQKTNTGYVLVLKPGQKIVDSLKTLQVSQNIQSASLSGIGYVKNSQMAYYDLKKKKYVDRLFKARAEVVSLTGNLSWLDGKPWVHIHMAIGDSNYLIHGGHLINAEVAGTAEIFVLTDPKRLERRFDSNLNAAFIHIPSEQNK